METCPNLLKKRNEAVWMKFFSVQFASSDWPLENLPSTVFTSRPIGLPIFFRINAADNFKTNLLFSRMYVYKIIEWQETIKKLLVNYTLGPMHKIIPLNYGLPRSSHLHIFLVHKIERKSNLMSFSKILCFWVKKNSLSKQKAFTIWARCPCLLEGSFRLKIIEN